MKINACDKFNIERSKAQLKLGLKFRFKKANLLCYVMLLPSLLVANAINDHCLLSATSSRSCPIPMASKKVLDSVDNCDT